MTLSFRQTRNLSVCILLAIAISSNLFAYQIMRRTAARIRSNVSVGQAKLLKWSSFLEAIRDSKDYLYGYNAGKNTVISPAILLIDNEVNQAKEIAELDGRTEPAGGENTLIK